MSRLLGSIQDLLLNEMTIGFMDAVLLCLGLTITVAAAVPALITVRRGRGGRS